MYVHSVLSNCLCTACQLALQSSLRLPYRPSQACNERLHQCLTLEGHGDGRTKVEFDRAALAVKRI